MSGLRVLKPGPQSLLQDGGRHGWQHLGVSPAGPLDLHAAAWANRLHRRQQLTHAATTAAHTLRGGDGGSSSQGPSLRDSDS